MKRNKTEQEGRQCAVLSELLGFEKCGLGKPRWERDVWIHTWRREPSRELRDSIPVQGSKRKASTAGRASQLLLLLLDSITVSWAHTHALIQSLITGYLLVAYSVPGTSLGSGDVHLRQVRSWLPQIWCSSWERQITSKQETNSDKRHAEWCDKVTGC